MQQHLFQFEVLFLRQQQQQLLLLQRLHHSDHTRTTNNSRANKQRLPGFETIAGMTSQTNNNHLTTCIFSCTNTTSTSTNPTPNHINEQQQYIHKYMNIQDILYYTQ